MSNQFPPEADDQMPEKKSSQQLLLLLLLLLVVLFGYLYFFTGVIRSRQNQAQSQPVVEALVKKPLPPRLSQKGAVPATPETKTAAGTQEPKAPAPPAGEAKPVAPAPSAKVAPAAKPAAPAPVAKPAKPAPPEAKAAKPAAAQQAKSEKPAAPAAAAPQAKGAKPAAPAKEAKGAKPAAPAKEAKAGAQAEKKGTAAAEKKGAAKPVSEAKPAATHLAGVKSAAAQPKKPKAAAKPATPAYALDINGDLAESEMGPILAKLKRAGVSHVVQTKSHKGEPMHRLFLADFANRDEALEELDRLKLAAPSAFMLKENGRYTVYAGSYLREGKAALEQDRLFEKGVKLLLRSATASVAVVKLRAGSFADQASAERSAGKLKKAGLSAKVVKLEK
jgi:hypothetical protein